MLRRTPPYTTALPARTAMLKTARTKALDRLRMTENTGKQKLHKLTDINSGTTPLVFLILRILPLPDDLPHG